MNVFTLCGFLLATLCVNLLLHRIAPEFTPLTVAASGVLLGVYLLKAFLTALLPLAAAAQSLGLSAHMELLLKALAISLACNATSSLCRDCGESALGEKAELAGKIAILSLCIPLLVQLLELF
ncbi:MAG: hypothetical protein E7651_04755 [Ruminococcaceae bacterium]|nr:hypothetical protein [Oscillospiraceae bacterium]MBQ8323565.1 hypothetical protein [Clostridia bacterium]MBQ9793452.1 hypothetical protein [Clostridia bacterium]